jgi:mycothiol synthase
MMGATHTDATEVGRAAPPPGLVLRPYAGPEDIAEIVRIGNAENEADGIPERLTEAGERTWFESPSDQFDARRDVLLAELDGEVVAFAGQEWVDTREEEIREFRVWGAVDPRFRRRGIGSALLADNERRARLLAERYPTERRRVFGSFAADARPGGRLLAKAGYEVTRYFFEMACTSLEVVEDVPLPDGLELRPVTRDQFATIWRANREAFRDHWGGSDESEAAMNRFFGQPDNDPALWLIAWDGDEVAGGVINGISAEENTELGIQRGWLHSVFTRRPWRRRGLARALIAKSMILLRERGMTSAALGVDADNPTGALGLYRDAGFEVFEQFNAWRKPMDDPA